MARTRQPSFNRLRGVAIGAIALFAIGLSVEGASLAAYGDDPDPADTGAPAPLTPSWNVAIYDSTSSTSPAHLGDVLIGESTSWVDPDTSLLVSSLDSDVLTWSRNGTPIGMGEQYTVTEADIDQSITFTETATYNGHVGVSSGSIDVTLNSFYGNVYLPTSPTLTPAFDGGGAAVDAVQTLMSGVWEPNGYDLSDATETVGILYFASGDCSSSGTTVAEHTEPPTLTAPQDVLTWSPTAAEAGGAVAVFQNLSKPGYSGVTSQYGCTTIVPSGSLHGTLKDSAGHVPADVELSTWYSGIPGGVQTVVPVDPVTGEWHIDGIPASTTGTTTVSMYFNSDTPNTYFSQYGLPGLNGSVYPVIPIGGGSVDYNIVIPLLDSLQVTVTDPDGVPYPGMGVRAIWGPYSGFYTTTLGETDASGTVTASDRYALNQQELYADADNTVADKSGHIYPNATADMCAYGPVPFYSTSEYWSTPVGTGFRMNGSSVVTQVMVTADGAAPAITATDSGAVRAGATLSVSNGTWTCTDANTVYHYTWYANGAPIADSDHQTYTPTASQIGAAITADVRAVEETGGTQVTGTLVHALHASAQTLAVGDAPLPYSGPVISDLDRDVSVLQVGDTLSATTGVWTGATPTAYHYQWYVGTTFSGVWTPVGTDSSTLVITPAMVGQQLRADSTAVANGSTSSANTGTPTGNVNALAAPTYVGGATLTGDGPGGIVYPGGTVTLTPGTWSLPLTPDTLVKYVWYYSDGQDETVGENDCLYNNAGVPLSSGVTCFIPSDYLSHGHPWVAVNFSVQIPGHAESDYQGVWLQVTPLPLDAPTVAPSIAGTASVGNTLTLTQGTWADGVSLADEWYRKAPGATSWSDTGTSGASYGLTESDCGASLKVVETGSKVGSSDRTADSNTLDVALCTFTALTDPIVSGTAQPGQDLSVTAAAWSLSSVDSVDTEWYRGTTLVGTGSTYHVVGADYGTSLHVRETAHQSGYQDATAQSSDVAVSILGDAPTNTAAPTIGNCAPGQVGTTLTAAPGTWNSPEALDYSYIWHRGDDPLPAGTGSTFGLVGADYGTTVHLSVEASAAGYQASVLTVDCAVTTLGAAPTATAAPSITGTAKEGQTLTAHTGTWSPSDGTYTYDEAWTLDGAAAGTGATLVLPTGSAGKTVGLVVTAHLAGYTDGVAAEVTAGPVASASSGGSGDGGGGNHSGGGTDAGSNGGSTDLGATDGSGTDAGDGVDAEPTDTPTPEPTETSPAGSGAPEPSATPQAAAAGSSSDGNAAIGWWIGGAAVAILLAAALIVGAWFLIRRRGV